LAYQHQAHGPLLAQAGDDEIRNADAAMLTPTTFVRDHLYGAGNARMECGTCHSVHNKGNAGERLLWRSDQNSKLCLTCHDKGLYTAP
jgi:predicted CXXCH cytochrome family protein